MTKLVMQQFRSYYNLTLLRPHRTGVYVNKCDSGVFVLLDLHVVIRALLKKILLVQIGNRSICHSTHLNDLLNCFQLFQLHWWESVQIQVHTNQVFMSGYACHILSAKRILHCSYVFITVT